MTRRSLSLSSSANALLTAVRALLSEGQGYLVGGSLRDALLDRQPADLDVAVPSDAANFARDLASRLRGHFVLLDAQRGTARVVLDEGDIRTIDITLLRGDIRGDLAQRDFTIDALAAPIAEVVDSTSVELFDPHGGLADLEAGIVRLV